MDLLPTSLSPAAQSIEAAFRPDTKLATRDAEEKANHTGK